MLGARRPYRKDSLLDRGKGSVRLLDRGSMYVEALLVDTEGNVTQSRLLFPLALRRASSQAHRRWLRKQDEDDEQRRA
jgi:hypothetical protein